MEYKQRGSVRYLLFNNRRTFRREKREQFHGDSDSNRTELVYYLGLKFDGEEKYLNLSTVPGLQQYGTLTVHDGPVIYTRKAPIKYKDLGDGPLIINGSRLLQGIRITDYNITVGGQACVIVEISNIIIMCQPPEEKPQQDTDDESNDPVIMVRIGTNIAFRYGTLQYPSNMWIIIGPVVGALVVLIAVLIAIICILLRRKNTKAQKHKGKYHYSPGEMIRLPSVNQDRSTEPFSIPDSNNGSLLVFNQDPDISELRDPELGSHYDASSAVTTTDDEFDPPEEFYENKETIKRQNKHKKALDQFMGNSGRLTPRYTAEPQNAKGSKKQPGSTGQSQDIAPEYGRSATENSTGQGRSEEDIYMNDDVSQRINNSPPITDEDIYENSKVKSAVPSVNKKHFLPRKPTRLPDIPKTTHQTSSLPQTSNIPPPVPNTPRPKLNLMPKRRHNDNRPGNYKHHSLGHPFEEHPYSNSRLGRFDDDDDDDIYVNSPIKSRGLRTSGNRRRARSPRSRRQNGRGATLWY